MSPKSLAITVEERGIKLIRVAKYLDSHDLDAALLSRRCNFSWFTCGGRNYVGTACDVGNSWLLVEREKVTVLTSNIEATRLAVEDLVATDIAIRTFPYADLAARDRVFSDATASLRVAADAPAPGQEFATLAPDVDQLRWTLTPREIDSYRDLTDDVVASVESCAHRIRPGMTEDQIAGQLSAGLRARGCLPWVLLVAVDGRIDRHRHPLPTDAILKNRVMLVTCAERHGLIAACTRIASFGPLSPELVRKHEAVATVDAALITSTRAGTTLGELFDEAKEAYRTVGFPEEWRLHHQGGSCGYLPREVKASPGNETVVLADQAFAWNPSITGAKSEDTIICRETGPELLAHPTDWPMIDAEWKGQSLSRPAVLEL